MLLNCNSNKWTAAIHFYRKKITLLNLHMNVETRREVRTQNSPNRGMKYCRRQNTMCNAHFACNRFIISLIMPVWRQCSVEPHLNGCCVCSSCEPVDPCLMTDISMWCKYEISLFIYRLRFARESERYKATYILSTHGDDARSVNVDCRWKHRTDSFQAPTFCRHPSFTYIYLSVIQL